MSGVLKDIARDAARDEARDIERDLARDLAKDLGTDLARDFAKDFGKDLARDVGRDAAQDLIRDSARDLTRDLIRDSARDALKAAGKTGLGESLEDSIKDGIKDGSESFAKGITSAQKKVIETSAKDIIEDAFKKLPKEISEGTAKAAESWTSKVMKYVAVAGIVLVAADSISNQLRKNGENFEIIRITDTSEVFSSTYTANLLLNKGETFSTNDTVTISDCPIITPGDYKINAVISESEIQIITHDKVTTTNPAKGHIVLHTVFTNELLNSFTGILHTAGVASGGGVNAFLDGLGLPSWFNFTNIIIFIAVIIGLIIVFKVIPLFFNKSYIKFTY